MDPDYAEIDGAGPNSALTVAVLDTGISGTHPLLVDNFTAYVDFVDDEFTSGPNGQRIVHTNPGLSEDPDGHGTHVSGTIASSDPQLGVAPAAELIGLRVLGNGQNNGDVAEALQWVLDNRSERNIVAVNMSLGWEVFFTAPGQETDIPVFAQLRSLIGELEQAGVTVISAAGNSYFANAGAGQGNPALRENVGAPAISSHITVGAVWEDGSVPAAHWSSGAVDFSTGADRLTSFSQRLSDLDSMVFAPGALIESTVPGGGVASYGGTSMASPVTTGVVTLMQDAALTFGGRLLAPSEVLDVLRATAETIIDGDDEDDNVANGSNDYLRINAYDAVREVRRRLGDGDGGDPPTESGDVNGTLSTATELSDTLTSSPQLVVARAEIGADPGSTATLETDVDLYQIVLSTSGLLSIETVEASGTTGGADTMLRLFDSDGNELGINDDGGTGFYSLLDAQLSAGTYFIGVSGFANSSYNPSVVNSGVPHFFNGDYGLQLSFADGIEPPASGDRNNTLATATDLNQILDDNAVTGNFAIGILIGSDPVNIQGSNERVNVGAEDVDLAMFTVTTAGNYIFETNGDVLDSAFDSDGDGLYDDFIDTYLRLFDSTGNEIARDDDGGEGLYSSIQQTLQPGTYYIGVSGFGNSNYDVNDGSGVNPGSSGVATLNVTYPNSSNLSDPSGTRASAIPIDLAFGETSIFYESIGRDYYGNDSEFEVNTGADVDFYEFTAPVNGVLLIDTDTPFGSEFNNSLEWVDTWLRVFAEDSADQILFSDDDRAQDFQQQAVEVFNSGTGLAEDSDGVPVGHTLDSFARIDVTAGETYFIGISAFGNGTYDPDSIIDRADTGGTGEYDLHISYGGGSTTDVDGAISDNLTQINLTSSTPEAPVSVNGNIGSDVDQVGSLDVDFHRISFTGNQSRILTVGVDASQNGSGLDPMAFLFSEVGEELAFNDDSDGLDSRFQISVQPDVDYYVAITSFGNFGFDPFIVGSGQGGNSSGDYTLNLDLAPNDDDPDERDRLPIFLSQNPDTGPDLDLDVVGLDLTAQNVFEDNGLSVFAVGDTPLFLTGSIGQDVDSGDGGTGTSEAPALRNAYGPIFLNATGGRGNVNIESVGPDDVDIFPIRVTATGIYEIATSDISGNFGNLSANIDLRLYEVDGTEVLIDEVDSPRQYLDSQVVVQLEAGDYFLVAIPEGSAASRFDFSTQSFSSPLTLEELNEFALNAGTYDLTVQALSVAATAPEFSGSVFGLTLSQGIDVEAISLYDGRDADDFDGPSVALTGPGNSEVDGSLVFDERSGELVFIPTDPVLPAGQYSYSLREQDVQTQVGASSLGTGELQASFTVEDSPVVYVPGFARAPSQPLTFGASNAALPIQLSDGAGVSSLNVTMSYNPSLLNVSNVSTPVTDWTVSSQTIENGVMTVSLSGPALPSGPIQILEVIGAVPDDATYNASNILRIDAGGRTPDGAAVAFGETSALHKVVNFADLNRDGVVDFGDVGIAADFFFFDSVTGVDAFDAIDPTLIGDVNGDGFIDFGDVPLMADEFFGDSPAIPPTYPIPTTLGPDPEITISSETAAPGDTVTLTVSLSDTADAVNGIKGMQFGVQYDPNVLSIVPADVTISDDISALDYQFQRAAVIDSTAGTIRVGITPGENGIAHEATPDVFSMRFTVNGDAAGTTPVTFILENGLTRVFDFGGANQALELTPVNGSVTVTDTTEEPTVAITPNSGTTSDSPILFTFEFSEDVTGFGAGDVTLTNGTAGTFTAVDADTYTLQVTPVGDGEVTASVAEDVTDGGNAPGSGAVIFDATAPTVTVTPNSGTISDSPITFTFDFNEDVTGFEAGDVSLTNGTAGTFAAIDGNTYTLQVTPTADGDVTVSVAAGAAVDAASNDSEAASATVTFAAADTTAPALTITPNGGNTSDDPIEFTFEFSEAVSGFEQSDVAIVNGIGRTFRAVDDNTFILNVVPQSADDVTVTIAAGSVTDLAGNAVAETSATATSTVNPTTPSPELDAAPRFTDEVQPTISWASVDGAAGYEIWFARVTPGEQRLFTDSSLVTDPSWTPAANLEPAFYRYWVRTTGANEARGPWSGPQEFDVRPTLTGPLSPTFEARPTFEWEAIPGATGYQIFIRTEDPAVGNNGDIVDATIPAGTTSYTPSVDLPGGTIRWWVRASDSRGNRGWSDAGVTGNRTAVTAASSTEIAWQATTGAGRYVLVVADASGAVVIREDRLTSTSFAVSGLAVGNYRAWVKAIDATTDLFTTGFWSRGLNFSVAEANESAEEDSLDPLRQAPAESQPVVTANPERPVAAEAFNTNAQQEQIIPVWEDKAAVGSSDATAQSSDVLTVVDLLMADHFDLAETLADIGA